ncbi:MAG TPA: hypothetical protein VN785_02125 [Candidatus Angelobacter sp.]|nr:hypothetical protein [Candidatus Angelobacter sp.]
MNSKATLVLTAFFVFTVGSSRATYAAPPTDACSLLTAAQVSAILGVSVGAGEKILPNSTASCGWEVPGQKNLGRKRAVLNIYTQMGSRTPVQRFNTAKTPIQGITKEPVTGVGDDAIFATTPGLGTGLIFRKGDAAFDLRIYGFPIDQIKAKEKKLADCVIQKLTNGRFSGECPA